MNSKMQLRLLSKPSKWLLTIGLVSACLAILAWQWLGWHRAKIVIPSHSYQLVDGRMDEWRAVGGDWTIANGVIYNHSNERGSKLLTGSPAWGDYAVNTDVRFEGVNADIGVIIRTNDEKKEGSDTYNGYYIGLRTLDGTMVIGRSAFGWSEAPPVPIPGGVHSSVWYRLRVVAYGCNIAASVQNLSTLQTAWMAFDESDCLKTGHIGLRSLSAGGMWRNISVTGAGWNDYMELRQHAASVERPEILPGPPWWTPWRVGMLFAGTLFLALLTQLTYFRIQQWKAYTITRERERLAHDIHDTMAQGFAGVGYQIQGIRNSVVRGDRLDLHQIADQLTVAYQLVRSCHGEASRTIAMLGSASPPIQQNLLGALAEAARRIAGDQITISAELRGTSIPLNLRLANAMLHIGQQAVANAVDHGNPSVLRITLSYEGSSVELVVEDNGRGFEYTTETAGFGIQGMQKRARDVAATFLLISSPGHGTQVRVNANVPNEKIRRRILARAKQIFRKTLDNTTVL
jgi:signal transduction histidine kinase